MAPRPLSVATAAVAGGTAAAALLVAALWAAWARSSTAVPSEASVPATAASSRELRRRVHRYGNSFPEADVPHYPLLGRAYALTSLHNIAARIGNVFNLEIFVIDSLAAGGPENLRRIFSLPDTFQTAYPPRWLDLLGHSAVSFVGKDEHRRIRNLLNMGISKSTISSCYERINELAIETLASIAKAEAKKGLLGWLGKGDAKGVEVHIFFRRFTFSIICVFIAGADPKQSAQLTTCRTDIETIVAGLGDLVFPTALPFSPFNVGMKTREKVVNILQRLIDNRRARQDAGESFPDLLGNLMNGKMTDGVPMTDTEIIDNVIDILFAGYDTTSALLTTTMHYLTRVVSSTDRTLLQAEIDGLQFPGDMPTEEELQSLPVLDAFLKESLRIKTPINAVFRRAATDTELAGAPVKAGTILLAMNGPTMLDASQFPDPEAFDITRFLPGGPGDVAPTYAYLPFGSGPHMCLGMNLAKLEFKVFIFQLLRRYRVEAGSAPPVPESFPVQMFRSSVHLTERQA